MPVIFNVTSVLAIVACALLLGGRYPLMREFLTVFLISEAMRPCVIAVLRAQTARTLPGSRAVRGSAEKSADRSAEGTRRKPSEAVRRSASQALPENGAAGYFRDWLFGRKMEKLWAARAFSGFVLLLMLVKQPDFFQANIMMSAGMAVMAALLVARAAQAGAALAGERSGSPESSERAGASGSMKKISADGKGRQAVSWDNACGGRKRRRTAVSIFAGAAAVMLYLLLGAVLSGFPQPKPGDEYRDSFRAEEFYGDGVGTDRAVILEDNGEALAERVKMIRSAKERLILSTFDFRTDISGQVLVAALLEAAERGVDVRVVVDGVSGMLRMGQNPYFLALSSHPGAEIRIYNKINLLTPWKLMGRLHDKYLIVDETAYILGGRNSFSYFLGDWPGHKNYDRDVLVYNEGKSASSSLYQVEAYFEEIWNHEATSVYHDSKAIAERACVKRAGRELRKVYAQYLAERPEAAAAPDYRAMTYATGKITLLANPTTVYAKEPTVFYALTELMKRAEKRVMIHTPYIIANDFMYDAFASIAAAVPEAGMMTNSVANNGNPFGAGDYRANFEKILSTGIQLLEYEGGVSYHGKSIVIDDNISIVGSFNMDMRSVYLDTELMLVIDSEEVNAQLRELLSRYEKECGIVQPDGTRLY
ncbi:MAG: phospholipase D family protein, partial [Lachnospiraceae bacterium]|nr:phospholipase D family protein [Lachnospiraceae bacterium]